MVDETPALGRIGRYDLLARLGAGGMGEVFLGRATGAAGFEKQVVIKRILPQLAGDERFVRRLLEEGKLQVQLQHSGIVQVLDLGEIGGVPYLVMEYVDVKGDLNNNPPRKRNAKMVLDEEGPEAMAQWVVILKSIKRI